MSERFIARQPIFDYRLRVFGYELLFRSGETKSAPPVSDATAQVVASSTMVFGLENLVGNGHAFVNIGLSELLNGAALLLPPSRTVLELHESIAATPELIRECENLQRARYALALDNFRDLAERKPLLPFVSFLKVDFLATTHDEQKAISDQFAASSVKLIASRIERWEDFNRARLLRYSYFQGFFFLEPQMLRRQDVPGTKLTSLRLLQAVHASVLDHELIEKVLKEDPGLTYKLLSFLNSPAMERPVEVTSVRNAIALLGDDVFRRWATVAAVVTGSGDKPHELLRTALMRAFFCEEIARSRTSAHSPYEFFLVGLLSVMDALLNRPLKEIVEGLAVSADMKAALSGESNDLAHALAAVLAYERGEWPRFAEAMERLAAAEDAAPQCFATADRRVKALV